MFLGRVIRKAGAAPKYLITDHGKQFAADTIKRWCRRRGIGQRFGAVGKYGSLAVIERLIRTIKDECTRRLSGQSSWAVHWSDRNCQTLGASLAGPGGLIASGKRLFSGARMSQIGKLGRYRRLLIVCLLSAVVGIGLRLDSRLFLKCSASGPCSRQPKRKVDESVHSPPTAKVTLRLREPPWKEDFSTLAA
jgi:transposase InsO family protein